MQIEKLMTEKLMTSDALKKEEKTTPPEEEPAGDDVSIGITKFSHSTEDQVKALLMLKRFVDPPGTETATATPASHQAMPPQAATSPAPAAEEMPPEEKQRRLQDKKKEVCVFNVRVLFNVSFFSFLYINSSMSKTVSIETIII